MTCLESEKRGLRAVRRGGVARAVGLAALLALLAGPPLPAEAGDPVTIAVGPFELIDKSAAGGLVEPDPIDLENLVKSAEMARQLLADSGRYSIVDASGTTDAVAAAGGVQNCKGCEAPLAEALGAEQSMIGVITRVAVPSTRCRSSSGTASPATS